MIKQYSNVQFNEHPFALCTSYLFHLFRNPLIFRTPLAGQKGASFHFWRNEIVMGRLWGERERERGDKEKEKGGAGITGGGARRRVRGQRGSRVTEDVYGRRLDRLTVF